MLTPTRVHLHRLILLFFVVHLSQQVCVDVPSETEAVLGNAMKLTCIFCMRREEVTVKTRVEWYYKQDPGPNDTSSKTQIYLYEDNKSVPLEGPYKGRVTWNGSQDLQDVSIQILNVSYNDSGLYECIVHREFIFDSFKPSVSLIKNITLKVKEKASEDATALYSEIMMYVLLVFLTFWLLVEMVYCYRKISKSDEQVQDTAY